LSTIRKRIRTAAVAVATTVGLGAGLIAGLGPSPSLASSHREAPLVAADPAVDTTDVYAFVSPDAPKTVTLISNWWPFEEPAGGPNFYAFEPGVRYEFRIDNNGDAKSDVIYRFVFTNHYRTQDTFLYNTGQVTTVGDADLNFSQTYDLTRMANGTSTLLANDRIAVPSYVGEASMPDYQSLRSTGIYSFGSDGGRVMAGQADDPFFLDLRVFDLLYGTDLSEAGDDTLAGFNVNTLALRVPKRDLALHGDAANNPVIGIWATAYRQSTRVQTSQGTQSFSGGYVGVSRLGMPLVNEVVIPLKDKDKWNASVPANDGQFAGYVLDPDLPHLINSVYGIPVPDCDNDSSNGIDRSCDLVPVFLTGVPGLNDPDINAGNGPATPAEELRLNMNIPPCRPSSCKDYSRLGVIGGDNAGYPNGRRLQDDIIDISLQVVEGVLQGQDTGLGDGVNTNDSPFSSTFPYLGLPWSGSDASPHMAQTR